MNLRKSFLTLTIVGIMALMLCLAGTAIAGPGPNAGTVPTGYKTSGPSPKAFLMAGWIPNGFLNEDPNRPIGILEAYVWLDGKLYFGILDKQHPENVMTDTTMAD
ncbi:MAG: hypothetical protein MIO92_10605, partial [Methanosarcinaceae archaeon]|nr:hypothetical protein [Methanosarcinaceae archaeon]